jgi:hypothetical protein
VKPSEGKWVARPGVYQYFACPLGILKKPF